MSRAGMLAFPFGEYRVSEQVLLARIQREVYAGSERLEQFTDQRSSGYERLLYVHEDLMGNTRYYTKENGQSFAELTYDAWGMPESPNKLLNNDHGNGNYVYATYTGHIFDTTLDIYFAEARFYDANTRTWMAVDSIKDGFNWYQYCYSNPLKYWDPMGLKYFDIYGCGGALVVAKPIQAVDIFQEQHVAIFIQNQDSQVYFFSFEGTRTRMIKVEDYSIFDSLDDITAWVAPHYEFWELNNKDFKPYNDAVYIQGDFSASINKIYEWGDFDEEGLATYFKAEYNPTTLESLVDRYLLEGTPFYEPESGYSLLGNNCGTVAMKILSGGLLEDGRTVGDVYEEAKDEYYVRTGESLTTPSTHMAILRKSFGAAY